MKEQIEKQAIEEMAKLACTCFDGNCKGCPFDFYPPCPPKASAKRIYNAGYRKQSEVVDEFAKMLKEEMNNLSRMEYHCDPYFLVSKAFVDRIAAKMKGGE
jgi:hypothetical protein